MEEDKVTTLEPGRAGPPATRSPASQDRRGGQGAEATRAGPELEESTLPGGGTGSNKEYEISFLIRAEEDAREVLELVKSMQGEVSLEGPVAKISLAYPIKKETHAYFGYFHFLLSPDVLQSLDKALTMKQKVLRFLIITPPVAKYKEKKVVLPKRARVALKPLSTRPSKPISNEALEKKIEEILGG